MNYRVVLLRDSSKAPQPARGRTVSVLISTGPLDRPRRSLDGPAAECAQADALTVSSLPISSVPLAQAALLLSTPTSA